MSDSSEDADINDTPLNLSIDGKERVVDPSITLKCPLNLTIGGVGLGETVRKDDLSDENVTTVSNKRKLEEDYSNYIPPSKVPNSLHEVGNQIPDDVNKDNISQQVSFVIGHTQMNCTECIQAMNCTECMQASSFHGSQLEVVNSTNLEDMRYQNPSVQEKNKRISFDSGICIQDNPSPTVRLRDSPEDIEACSALDLSITTDSNIEVQEPTCNYCDETNIAVNAAYGNSEDIEMQDVVPEKENDSNSQDTSSPTLRICESVPCDNQSIPNKSTCSSTESAVANDNKNVDNLETLKKSKHVVLPTDIACDPILKDEVPVPNSHDNKSVTNVAVNVRYGKSEDIEMPNVVPERECGASSKDTSLPTITCGSVPCDNLSIPNKSANSNAEYTVANDNMCDPSLEDEVSIPNSHDNKSETNVAVNVTYEKSDDIEMPNVVPEMECDASSKDTSSPTILCESVPCDSQSKPNESTFSNTESTVANDNAYDPSLKDEVSIPNPHDNKSETNVAVHVTYGKSEDIEMPNVVSEMECVSGSENTSSPTILCESVPCDSRSKPNKSTFSNTESTVANDNKSETYVDGTCGKSEDIEMTNVVSEIECNVGSHNIKSPILICESVPCDNLSIPNKSAYSNAEYTVGCADNLETLKKSKHVVLPTDIACDPILIDDVSVHMPTLGPNSHGNKSETKVDVNVTSGKLEDIEMPRVVSEMECVSSSGDTSSPTLTCESVSCDSQSKPNQSTCSNTESTVANDNKSDINVDDSTYEKSVDVEIPIVVSQIECDDGLHDSSIGFEAKTVDIGTIGDSKAPYILHGSTSGANLQNTSDVTCSYENQIILSQSDNNKNVYEENSAVIAKESENTEELNILHNDEHKTDILNTDHLTFSSEDKDIQQEAIGSKSKYGNNAVDIGTLENSGNLDTSNILHGCKNDYTPNTSSPTTVTNQPLQIECKIYQDKVISSSDTKDSNFMHLCEEATKSFNDIDSDLSSSGGSYYEYVTDADFMDDSSQDCDWGPSEKNLEKMFKSVCDN